jgi:hypothetical protein
MRRFALSLRFYHHFHIVGGRPSEDVAHNSELPSCLITTATYVSKHREITPFREANANARFALMSHGHYGNEVAQGSQSINDYMMIIHLYCFLIFDIVDIIDAF